jgi:hypothetical protein
MYLGSSNLFNCSPDAYIAIVIMGILLLSLVNCNLDYCTVHLDRIQVVPCRTGWKLNYHSSQTHVPHGIFSAHVAAN